MAINREKLKKVGPQLCWGSPFLQKGMAGEAVALRAESELALGRMVDAVWTAINEAETKEDEVVRANGNEAEAAMAEAISLLNHFPATTREPLMKMALGAGSCKLSTMKPKKKILSKKKKKLFETKQSTLGGEKINNAGQNIQISEIEFGLLSVWVPGLVSFSKVPSKLVEIREYLKTIRNSDHATLHTTDLTRSMKCRERAAIKSLQTLIPNEVKKQEINRSQSCALCCFVAKQRIASLRSKEAFHRRMDSWAGFVVLSVCLSFCQNQILSVKIGIGGLAVHQKK